MRPSSRGSRPSWTILEIGLLGFALRCACLLAFLLAVLIMAAHAPARTADAPHGTTLLDVIYRAPDEGIQIDGRKRKIVRTENRYEYESEVSPNPKNVQILLRLDAAITSEQLEELASLIRASGIMQLAPSYGAPEGHRHYPYAISIRFQGEPAKVITYRSNPGFEAEPEAFKKIVAHLHGLSHQLENRP